MGSLIPGAAIIYTRVGEEVYAQYRDPPHNQRPRWHIGGTKGTHVTSLYGNEWDDIRRIAKQNPTLQLQLDKLLTTYYTIKSDYKGNTYE